MRQGLLRLAQVQEHLSEVIPGSRRSPGSSRTAWWNCSSAADLSPLSRSALARLLRAATKSGCQPDRLPEMPQGGVEIAAGHERRSEVAQDPRVIRLQPQRGPQHATTRSSLPECPVGLARGWRERSPRSGRRATARPISVDGPAGIPALEGDQAQEVEGVGLVRVLGQGGLVGPGGPIQVAPLGGAPAASLRSTGMVCSIDPEGQRTMLARSSVSSYSGPASATTTPSSAPAPWKVLTDRTAAGKIEVWPG